MSEEEIIELWKQGYSVEQIVEKHPLGEVFKRKGIDDWIIRHKIEKAVLKFQKGVE